MPYALSGLQDGKRPGVREIERLSEAMPHEVGAEENPAGLVWDAANRRLRTPTVTETLAEAKAEKRRELYWAADAQAKEEIPFFVGLQVAAKVGANTARAGAAVLTPLEASVRDRITAGQTRLNTLLAQLEAAVTVEAVRAVIW